MATAQGAKKLQPIIVKRVKKAAHAHHGGAWKIAYADFVTAMMAFFLLMWLLGSTAKGDLQGIASYFHSPLKVEMSGGPGSGSSSSIVTGGGKDLSRTHGEIKSAQGEAKSKPDEPGKAEQARQQDAKRMATLRAKIEDLIENNPKLRDYRSQIRLQMSIDGLEIQIVDDQNRPMFDSGSALVKPYMRTILQDIGTALNGIENRVALAGHTDAAPYGNGDRGYGNWELSADRANASRRELVASGMPDDKLVRVVGVAASDLLDKDNRLAPVNRRISITVLTREGESRLMGGGPAMEGNDAVKAITDQMKVQEKQEKQDKSQGRSTARESAAPARESVRAAKVASEEPARR